MDLDLLKTLASVAEEGSFTRAGERLGLTQQAVSAQIKRLEAGIGRQILSRHGTGARLTADGEALLAYARQSREIEERVRRHFSAVHLSGSIRIGILEGFAPAGLPPVLAALRRTQPDLDIVAETGFTETLMARLENGKLDVVFGTQRPGERQGDPLWCDDLRWTGDLEAFRDTSLPIRLVMQSEPGLIRAIAIETLTRAGRPFAVVFESESRSSLRAAALSGIGLAVFCSTFEGVTEGADADVGLPPLGQVEFFLRVADRHNAVIAAVADLIRQTADTVLRRHGSAEI